MRYHDAANVFTPQFGLKEEEMEAVQISSSHENLNTSANSTLGRVIANRVFVGNLPPNLVERDLMNLFNRFGKIRDVKIIPENTRNKSYGFVTFFSELDARRAIQVISVTTLHFHWLKFEMFRNSRVCSMIASCGAIDDWTWLPPSNAVQALPTWQPL